MRPVRKCSFAPRPILLLGLPYRQYARRHAAALLRATAGNPMTSLLYAQPTSSQRLLKAA